MTPARRHRLPAVGLALVALATVEAPAAVVVQLTFEDLAVRAHRIALGEVRSVEPRWHGDSGYVESVIELAVERDLADASAAPVLRIVQLGGRLGDRETLVPGQAEFHVGERVLVFVRTAGVDPDGTPFHTLIGMSQAKFLVLRDSAGAELVVQDIDGGRAYLAPDADGALHAAEPSGPLVLGLDDAVARIAAVRGEVAP
jgi:hypothetical protein